ncbi:MAG: PKD domain-containing protein, partial [Actinobacteria bacterium]|nr:PKD domain-containing protein [Actinomycetota bacterium]
MPRLRLLALTLGLLAAVAVPAARADGGVAPPGVRVTLAPSDGGAVRSLALADLSARFDVHGRTYRLRDVDGSERTVAVADGISLDALLAAAGLDGDAFDYIAVPDGNGSRAIVMRDDLGGADDGPPVVWSDAAGIHFLRPASGSGDANAVDYVTLPGTTLALRLRRGEPLEPRIAVSTLRARPHERIDFRASVAGGGPLPAGLAYQWYFDGALATGASVSHRFAGSGTYQVLLNVARGQTTIGDPAIVLVRVVRARERHPHGAREAGTSAGGANGSAGAGGGGGSAGSGSAGTAGGAG